MRKIKLRCYVCGKPILLGQFALISPSPDEVDRVFIAHDGDCVADIDEAQPVQFVTTTGTSKAQKAD